MNTHDFLELLQKYNRGEATKEEQQFIFSYYNLFESQAVDNDLLSIREMEDLKTEIFASIQMETSRVEANERRKRVIRLWSKISVAAILVVILTGSIFYFNQNGKTSTPYVSVDKLSKENRFFRLPDGSTIILGSGSKLNYPSSFDGLATREVYLEGQAFFDIKHNPSKPFIVHTGELATTVLGTAFNIKAFPADQNIVVSVVRGKVKVTDKNKTLGVIKPDEQIEYFKPDAKIVQKSVDNRTYLKWKEQDLLLDEVTFSEVAEILEERFKVNIAFTDSAMKNNRFTTTLKIDEQLDQILLSICEFNSASFDHNNNEDSIITISRK
ncbi:MAG TPA: FecR domain-containing protein [Flavitalea sp.]|nr:FecR domain-containing protein [Flavitalea sp.]